MSHRRQVYGRESKHHHHDALKNGFKCGPTGKIRFKSEGHAQTRIAEIQLADPSAKTLRAYQCEYCGGFHLTRKTLIARTSTN